MPKPHGTRTLTVPLPSPDEIAAMSVVARRDLLMKLALCAQEISAEQTLLAQYLTIVSDEPLWTAQETGKVLGIHPDTVRDRGREWGIQADLGEGIYRYNPERVRARRDPPAATDPPPRDPVRP